MNSLPHDVASQFHTRLRQDGRHDAPSPQREPQRWEREIFFQPRLVEAERREAGRSRRLAVLLALVLGLGGSGLALAGDGGAPAVGADQVASEGGSVFDWLLELLGFEPGAEQPETSALKGREDRDPDEGDP